MGGRLLLVGLGALIAGCGPVDKSPPISSSSDNSETDKQIAAADQELAQIRHDLELMAGNGGWMRKDGASKLTHEPEVQVLTMSKPYAGRYGKVQATMVVRCNEKTTAVTINWGEYLGDDSSDLGNWKRMRYRIDDKPAVNIRLSLSTNNEAVGWWSGAEAIPIIRQIVKADRFVAEITPYGENVRLAEFSVVGLAPHAADIAKACGWSIEPKPMPVN